MYKKFVIISQGRTGTSMVVNALNSLDWMDVYGELFARANNIPLDHPQEVQLQMVKRYIRNSYDLSGKKTVKEFLDDLYFNSLLKYVGFKLLYPHLNRSFGTQIIDYIQNNPIYKIILYRENKLKQVISAQTNKVEGKIHVDAQQVITRAKYLINEEKMLNKIFANGDFCRVSYEQMTENKNLDYLDLMLFFPFDEKVKVPLKKYRPNKISENITNFSILRDEIERKAPELKKWLD